ncbi:MULTISPECIES: hypothetical protein [unclassified Streptomyces]|uniref:hypothetical protein n=1 Tax=unclassified Streptomyces TaxID=2593676 RepID=UPI00365C31E3
MTHRGGRRGRFAAVGSLGVLVALLFCFHSTGAFHSTSVFRSAGVASVGPGPGGAGVVVLAAGNGQGQTPGCGRSGEDDGASRPVTPSRGTSSHELLPALHDVRAAAGSWGAGQCVLSVSPERGPPPLAAPSPVDLSVLRV